MTKDITGQKFGMLTIVKQVPKPEDKKEETTYWECLCDCGGIVIRGKKTLMKGKKKGFNQSCGCEFKKDYTGKRYGRLVVIGRNPNDHIFPSGKKCPMWDCQCDCGGFKTTMQWSLDNGDTTSCGCYNAEINGERGRKQLKKYNKYNLESADYGIGYTEKGDEFWFDKEDYDLIKDYCWNYNGDGYLSAVDATIKKHIKFHRLVMNAPEDLDVDHIVHPPRKANKYDNRKSNLRIATNQENTFNHHLSIANTSGVTGVTWSKSHNKWQAYIGHNMKHIHLGYFDDFEEAVKVRKEAEKKYFKDWRIKE